jgi:hypothetical protein
MASTEACNAPLRIERVDADKVVFLRRILRVLFEHARDVLVVFYIPRHGVLCGRSTGMCIGAYVQG